MSWLRVCLVAAAVILIAGFTECAEEAEPKSTYVGPLEKLVLTLMKPIEKIEDIGRGIGNSVKDWISKIPGVKNKLPNGESAGGRSLGDILNPFKDKIRAIYPGTRWCGDGDIAKDEEDLGFFNSTDVCCRDHDNCKDGIPAQESRDGLLNNGLFTRSPCHCDEAFYRCLKEAKSLVATHIGTTYFNVLRPQCLKKDYPIKNCKKYAGSIQHLLDDKCLEYNFDTEGEQKYQWFDNPDFLGQFR